MPMALQAKLLRALQDRSIERHALGVLKQTLYDKLRRLHIDATAFRAGPA
jgi:DNA-binding NtrC family response regulator